MTSTPGFEPGPHWWEVSALTTVPPSLREKKWLLQSDPDEKEHQLGRNIQATINNLSLITSQEKLYTCVCIWSRSKPASGASWPFISWEVRSSATKTSRSFSKTYRANNHKNSQITHRKFSSIGNVTLRREHPVVFLNEEEKRSPNI